MGINEQIKVEAEIKSELDLYDEQQTALAELETSLNANPEFAKFLAARKEFAELEAKVWKRVEQVMIDNNLKTVKTDKMTLTIANRISFDIDQSVLPEPYFKRVPDTTKIAGQFKLHGTPVDGTAPKYTQYLVKRIKAEK